MANFNFDEIKRSATGVADRAVKKTGDVTNLVKLKVSIKSAESKLSSVYEEIGRLFYTAERSGEDCTSDIAAYIMKADKLKADIAAFNKQIAKLRNVRICDSCGNEIDKNVNFCPVCGAKQETLVEVEPEPKVEEVVEKVEETVTDAFDEAKDKAEEFFANIADTVSEKAEDAKDAACDLCEKAEDAAEDAAEKVEDVIENVTEDKE
jgi:rubrerythrin